MEREFPRALNNSILSGLRCILPLFLLLVSNSGPLKEVLLVAISDTVSRETARSHSGWVPAGGNYVMWVSSKRRNDQIGALNLQAFRGHVLHSHPHDNVCSQRMCRVVRVVGNEMGETGWQDDLVIRGAIRNPKKGAPTGRNSRLLPALTPKIVDRYLNTGSNTGH